ncbi:MAG: AAA family ATPase [Planctomycetes bacterium]|nr:AAA family ATPase [Planctomycetota bacterium]
MESSAEHDLGLCLRSRVTLLVAVSVDEDRVLSLLRTVCKRLNYSLFTWDHADFLQQAGGKPSAPPPAKDALSALEMIDKMAGPAVFVLRDFHQCWENQPRVVRKLRNLAERLKYTKKTIVVTMPCMKLPEELKDAAVIFDLAPPDTAQLDDLLSGLLSGPGVKIHLSADARKRLIRSALGLSTNQAQRVFAKAIVSEGVLDERDIDLIALEKKQIIRESGALEFFIPRETVTDVGGLGALKDWLHLRERAFSEEAEAYGLPPPKGIALIGIPGSGKSLSARMIAGLWRLPLLRLDVGALFGQFVGQSEENTRRALRLAETVSPCVLWIDEIEKALSVGQGDGGTSMRVLATVLSWMQEKRKPVFIVATANRIELIPPELLRRGRFDEIFFLDLPTAEERRAIFEVHLRKRGRKPGAFDLDALSAASDGYVGAEIEQAVIDAMYVAFNDRSQPGREIVNPDIRSALSRLVPLSRSQREVINALRQWLVEGRAQSASAPDVRVSGTPFVRIPIDPVQES